jgi:hypothetical protein
MPSDYDQIIEAVFRRRFAAGDEEVPFARADLVEAADALGLERPKNLGDVVYTFRHRRALPDAIRATAPEGRAWIIVGRGRARYAFALRRQAKVRPDPLLDAIDLPDATPGLVSRYALSDEQALLSKVRYNRLLDTFMGVTCYSIQNHLRTTVTGIGQVETDEIYIGVSRHGAHYAFPVQAKGGSDEIGIVQIEQDLALCAEKFPALIARAIAAQFMAGDVIALFAFRQNSEGRVVKTDERHYRLVPQEAITEADLDAYRARDLR